MNSTLHLMTSSRSRYTPPMRIVLGLGGNLGDPPKAFDAALAALTGDCRVLARSALYRSDPVGPPQPQYWNASVLVDSSLSLLDLLARCQSLEAAAGRRREEGRWGPRPLDLDLLVADGAVHRGPRLMLPHVRFGERAFAAVPAAEVAPEWVHPLLGVRLAVLARRLGGAGLERVADGW